jgi:hypothetical protein
LAGLAAVGIAGADAWLTQRESNAAALRRDAESASLKLDAGDIPPAVILIVNKLAPARRARPNAAHETMRPVVARRDAIVHFEKHR